MSLEHTQAYVITERAISSMNFRVYIHVPALNINHPADHHDQCQVQDRRSNCAVRRPPSRPLSW